MRALLTAENGDGLLKPTGASLLRSSASNTNELDTPTHSQRPGDNSMNEQHGNGESNGNGNRTAAIERLVDNKIFTTVARLAMLFASMIALPVAGFMLVRIINSADSISASVNSQATDLKLIKQEITSGFDRTNSELNRMQLQITDHEGRIRALERPPTVIVPAEPVTRNRR